MLCLPSPLTLAPLSFVLGPPPARSVPFARSLLAPSSFSTGRSSSATLFTSPASSALDSPSPSPTTWPPRPTSTGGTRASVLLTLFPSLLSFVGSRPTDNLHLCIDSDMHWNHAYICTGGASSLKRAKQAASGRVPSSGRIGRSSRRLFSRLSSRCEGRANGLACTSSLALACTGLLSRARLLRSGHSSGRERLPSCRWPSVSCGARSGFRAAAGKAGSSHFPLLRNRN